MLHLSIAPSTARALLLLCSLFALCILAIINILAYLGTSVRMNRGCFVHASAGQPSYSRFRTTGTTRRHVCCEYSRVRARRSMCARKRDAVSRKTVVFAVLVVVDAAVHCRNHRAIMGLASYSSLIFSLCCWEGLGY